MKSERKTGNMANKSTHGGPNRGQGAKPLPPEKKRKAVTVRLDPETIETLKSQHESQGVVIDKAVKQFLRGTDHGRQKKDGNE
jgi:hypothetical protein